MGKISHPVWKQWETSQPAWMREKIEDAFERFIKQKWRDTLNVAALETFSWETWGKYTNQPRKNQGGAPKRTKGTGARARVAAVEDTSNVDRRR
jgi:hypothetical protein